MTLQLNLEHTSFEARAISPFQEMGAYEAMWCQRGTTFSTLAKKFDEHPGSLPSHFVSTEEAQECGAFVFNSFEQAGIRFGVRVHGAGEYPVKLRDDTHPIEVLYYEGWWDLVSSRSVAVVGTRQPSEEGLRRARRLVGMLVEDNFTVVSGLAAGIDTMAHKTAIEAGGRTVAVIGTPLSHTYPHENEELQRRIARDFLVVSQVPLKRYESQTPRYNRLFFPERNKTMSALTEATIIVEASETSGTVTQARAALQQGRKLFILDNCFQNPELTWPARFEARGAIRVRDYDDIRDALS